MYVSDILRNKGARIVSLKADDPVPEAIALLCSNRIGAVLVLDNQGRIAGIFSERDLVRGLQRHGGAVTEKSVGELMTSPVITCSPRDPVASIEGMMTANRFRHVPVMDEGQLVGIISIGDVVKTRIEEAQSEVDALRRYISL
jgi:Predicted signal-transduction protein containing cAMP-binding and CBS domains